MKREHYLLFLVFFLAILFSVPLVQAFSELREKNAIQALDLATDALITPYKRSQKSHELARQLARQAGKLDKTFGDRSPSDTSAITDSISQLLDSAIVAIGDLKKIASAINRYVSSDSSTEDLSVISICGRDLDTLGVLSRAQSPVASLQRRARKVAGETKALAGRYPAKNILDGVWLSILNLPNIFWDARYLRPYEKEMENASLFARGARPVMHFLRYALFRDLGEKAIAGKSTWFFYKPDVQYISKPYITDSRNFADPSSNVVDPNLLRSNEEPIQKILNFQKQLKDMNIDLLVVIAPGKPSIYPDMLAYSKIAANSSGAVSPSLRFLADLREKGVDVVDLFGPFASERANDAIVGDSLYLQKDTHWKARALRLASHCVAERIKQYPWFVPGTSEFALDSLIVHREGDIGVMTTLPAFKIGELLHSFPPEPTKCYQVFSVKRDATGIESRHLYKDEFSSSRILILGDSFSRIYQTDEPRGAGWIAHLAYELKQPVASIVSDGGASTLVRQSLARRPSMLKGKKLVVWEFVERDIRFGAEGWKDIELKM